jgi:hypothetical protein
MAREMIATARSSRMKETLAIMAVRNLFSEKMSITLFIELNPLNVKKKY